MVGAIYLADLKVIILVVEVVELNEVMVLSTRRLASVKERHIGTYSNEGQQFLCVRWERKVKGRCGIPPKSAKLKSIGINLLLQEGTSTRASISVARNNNLISLRGYLIVRIHRAKWQRPGTATLTVSESMANPIAVACSVAAPYHQD